MKRILQFLSRVFQIRKAPNFDREQVWARATRQGGKDDSVTNG